MPQIKELNEWAKIVGIIGAFLAGLFFIIQSGKLVTAADLELHGLRQIAEIRTVIDQKVAPLGDAVADMERRLTRIEIETGRGASADDR